MDPISDMIVQIKNAGLVGRERVFVPFSKMKLSIVNLLLKEGFLKKVDTEMKKKRKFLAVDLILNKRIPKIQGTRRISKPSKRVYKKHSEIRSVKNGYGLLVVSTPAGVMSGRDAKSAHLGGEVLFSIW